MRGKKAVMPKLPAGVDQSIVIRPVTEIAGVAIPEYILFFDCRMPDETPIPKAHYGESLWSGERAAYSLGLRLSWRERYDTNPRGIQFYFDSREPAMAGETARVVNDLIEQYRQVESRYCRAKRSPAGPGEGGGVLYKPVACYLANFGGGVIADSRECAVAEGRF